jgi:acetyltransferase-like isoleucine patch superfamily enzyme
MIVQPIRIDVSCFETQSQRTLVFLIAGKIQHKLQPPEKFQVSENMDNHEKPRPFAEDDSKNPPAMSILDRLIRRFSRPAYVIVVLLLYLLASTALGLALAPALFFFDELFAWSQKLPQIFHWIVSGFGLAVSFFIFGFTLLFVVSTYNWLLPTRVRPFKGGYYSLKAVPWLLHNGLFYLVRFTFLPFVTLTPFGIWFLKAMGMNLGRHVFINTEYISDPQLITLGNDVALGGSVRIFAHYGGHGNLVVEPVIVGERATIGLAATIMGDVQIGPDATILAHSVLMPGSRVGNGEVWGGVPARRINREEMEVLKKGMETTSEFRT